MFSVGWLHKKLMVVSVVVGFRYMSISRLNGFRIIKRFRKFILLLFSYVGLKWRFYTKNIAFYTRYMDDILLIYNSQHITPETIHSYINRIHPNLHFNPTYENNNSINFLNLLIIHNPFYLEIDKYRKPTTTDTTINFLSNHPTENKNPPYCYHINRMLSLPLTEER